MQKPTLVYVIAAARFHQPLEALRDPARAQAFGRDIAVALAAHGLVEVSDATVWQMEINSPENGGEPLAKAVPAAAFIARDERHSVAVNVDPSGVAIRSTAIPYQDHAWLAAPLVAALEVVAQHAPEIALSRLGLRYLDLLIPSSGTIAEYLTPPLGADMRTINLEGSARVSEQLQVAVFDDASRGSRLVLRCSYGEGRVLVPGDLAGDGLVELLLPEVPNGYALLDFDHFVEVVSPGTDLAIGAAKRMLEELHDGVTDVFQAALSNRAKLEWGVQ